MTHFDILFKEKNITRTDWQTAKFYKKLRYMVLRSMAVQDTLHTSSFERINSIKGITNDLASSKTLEQFWKGLEHYFKEDSLPVITILDSITGFKYPYLNVSKDIVKIILKKFRKVLKNLDIISLFEKIDEDFEQTRLAA